MNEYPTKAWSEWGADLDGEKIRLTAEEHVLAAEIDCDQRLVGKALDQTPVPQGLFQRLPQQPKVRLVRGQASPGPPDDPVDGGGGGGFGDGPGVSGTCT